MVKIQIKLDFYLFYSLLLIFIDRFIHFAGF